MSSLASPKTPKCTRSSESSTCDSVAENGVEKENMQPSEKINSRCSFNSFTFYPYCLYSRMLLLDKHFLAVCCQIDIMW